MQEAPSTARGFITPVHKPQVLGVTISTSSFGLVVALSVILAKREIFFKYHPKILLKIILTVRQVTADRLKL